MVSQIIKRQVNNFESKEKTIVWSVFILFVFLLISYGYLLNNTFMSAIKRQDLEKKIVSLNSKINSIEADYLEAKKSITLDLAISKGYILTKNQKYVSVAPVSSGLSMSINENN